MAIQFPFSDLMLQGTLHQPEGWNPVTNPTDVSERRVGILFWNAGYQPRSSQGDLAAYLADHTAKLGFPTFRFDMPGLGDSEGELPPEVLAFYEIVQQGGHVAPFLLIKSELIRRYGLKGIICMGHCGSATTAVYAADEHPDASLLGLIMIEPGFIWYRAPQPPTPRAKRNSGSLAKQRLKRLRLAIRAWLVRLPGGEALTQLYVRLEVACRRLRGPHLPADSNQRLLTCYRNLMARDFPILMLTAPPVKKRPDYFNYPGYLQVGRNPTNFTLVEVEGASHSFLEGDGRKVLPVAIQHWLQQRFPQPADRKQSSQILLPVAISVGAQ